MSLLAALACATVVYEVSRQRGTRRPERFAAGTAAALWQPLLAVAGAAAAGAWWWRRKLARARHAQRDAERDVAVLGELTVLGLSAGLTFSAALERASREVADDLATEVRSVLRRTQRTGSAGAFAAAEGRAQRLYRVAGRAASSGSSVLSAVQAFVDERRGEERTSELAAARKLPVRLIFPLALLILPGFTLLIVGPAVIGAVSRLGM